MNFDPTIQLKKIHNTKLKFNPIVIHMNLIKTSKEVLGRDE